MDETAQRKTTATSEEDEGAWVRIRRDDLYELRELQDQARVAGKADQELMDREVFGSRMHSNYAGGNPAYTRGAYSKYGGRKHGHGSTRQHQRQEYESLSYGESRSSYGQHQHFGHQGHAPTHLPTYQSRDSSYATSYQGNFSVPVDAGYSGKQQRGQKRNKQQRYQSPSTWNSNYQYGNSYTTSSSRAGLARANSAQQWQQRPGQDSSNQHHCA